jgi:predicted O-methyltransferase YrrM
MLARLEDAAAADGIPIVGRSTAVLIHLLTRLAQPDLIVELGTATGYSGVWLLRAWPAAHLITFEVDASRAAEARLNFDEAGLGPRAEVRVENAVEGLERLPTGSAGVVFNDVLNGLRSVDRVEQCFRAALRVLKSGGLLLADNVVNAGQVARRGTQQARRVHRWNELVHDEPSLTGMILPVGDGLSFSVRS